MAKVTESTPRMTAEKTDNFDLKTFLDWEGTWTPHDGLPFENGSKVEKRRLKILQLFCGKQELVFFVKLNSMKKQGWASKIEVLFFVQKYGAKPVSFCTFMAACF